MQNQAYNTRLEKVTSHIENSGIVDYLLSLDNSKLILERIRGLTTSVIETDLFYLFNQFETSFKTQIEQLKAGDTEVSIIEKNLLRLLRIIRSYYLVISERFSANESNERKKWIFGEEEFVFRILDAFFVSLVYFNDPDILRITLNIMEKMHLPIAFPNHFALFDRTLFSRYYKKFEVIESFVSNTYSFQVYEIYDRIFSLLNLNTTEYRNQHFLIFFLTLQKRGFSNYCIYSTKAVPALFQYLGSKLDELSYTPRFNPDSTFFSELRKPFNIFPSGSNEQAVIEDSSRADYKLEKVFCELTTLISSTVESNYKFATETEFFDKIVPLFCKVCYQHLNIYDKENLNMNSTFIKSVVLPIFNSLNQVFTIERNESDRTLTPKKVYFKRLRCCLLNYSTYLLNHIIKHENYIYLQEAMLIKEIEGCHFLDLLVAFYKILKNANLKSIDLQEKLIFFDESLIYLRVLFQFNDPAFSDLSRITRDYYSVFQEFYKRLGTLKQKQIDPKRIKFKPQTDDLYKYIIYVMNSVLDPLCEMALIKYRPFDYKEMGGQFLANYNILPVFSIGLLVLFSKNYHNIAPAYIVGVLNTFKTLMTDEVVGEFNRSYPHYFRAICSKVNKILLNHCSREEDSGTTFHALNYSTSRIIAHSSDILISAIKKYQFNPPIKDLNLSNLFYSYKLIDNCPTEYDVNAITPVFNLFDEMFSVFEFRNNVPKELVTSRFIYLFGHSFMLWAQHPRVVPMLNNMNENENIVQYESTLGKYQRYGYRTLKRLLLLLRHFEKDEEWMKLLTCFPLESEHSYQITDLARPGLSRLIQIPQNLMPLAKQKPSKNQNEFNQGTSSNDGVSTNGNDDYIKDSVISIINPLFRIMLCYKHNLDMSTLAATYFLKLISIPSVAIFVLNHNNYLGYLSFESTIVHYIDAKLYGYFNKIISKILVNTNLIRIILLRDTFGEWYRNILKHHDYATHNKATEPSKLTNFIAREIIKNYTSIVEIYQQTEKESNMINLFQYSSVGLCYCSLDFQPCCYFISGDIAFDDVIKFSLFPPWHSSRTPYGVLLRMLFNLKDSNEYASYEHLQTEPDPLKSRAAAYAINYHAFLKTTYMRRKLKATLKEVISRQHSIIEPLLSDYERLLKSGDKDEVTFKVQDSDSSYGEFKIPTCIVKPMSPEFKSILSSGSEEGRTKVITLPHSYFKTLEYLNMRLRVLTSRRHRRSNSKIEYHFLGDQPKTFHPKKCKEFFELATMYDIEFVRLYSFGTFLRQLLHAIRSDNPADSLYYLYSLYEGEDGDFPLFQKSPDLPNFLCHLIALYIDQFLEPEKGDPDSTAKTVAKPKVNGYSSSDVDYSSDDSEPKMEYKEDTKSDGDKKTSTSNDQGLKNRALIYRLNPDIMGKWWADLYFRPTS
ncbi:hypothetical protein K502DRAFT_365826 [Neoconidiobolus thromboides FSU 785]|nr:hypothetical protein K502DRAFT_365826 [Neoconidiobolus thromboides FSU 785]